MRFELLTVVKSSKCVCGRGCAPDPVGSAYSALPDLLARFRKAKGLHGKGDEERGLQRGNRRVGKEGEWRKGRGREGQTHPEQKFWLRP